MKLEIMTLARTKRALDSTTIDELRTQVRGQILTAADTEYDADAAE